MRNRKWINFILVLVLLWSFFSPFGSVQVQADTTTGVTLLDVTDKASSTVLVWEVVNVDEDITNYQLIKNGEIIDIEPVPLSESADGNVKKYSYEDTSVKKNTPYTYEIAAYTSSGNQLVSTPLEHIFVGQATVVPAVNTKKKQDSHVEKATETPKGEVVITNIKIVTDKGNIPWGKDFIIEGATEELAEVTYYGYVNKEGIFVDYESESSNIELPVGTYRLLTYNYITEEEISAEFTVETDKDYVSSPIEIVLHDEEVIVDKSITVEGVTEESISIWWDEPWFPEDFEKYRIYLDDELLEEITDSSFTFYTFSDLSPETEYNVKVEIVYVDGTIETLSDEITTSSPPTGEVVEFNDENLKNTIQEQLKIYHRDIYTDDMEKLTHLDASYLGITDLSGLELAVNLVDLMLYGNQIEDISPLTSLTKLSYLDLDDNLISNIESLGELENLETLFLAYNQLDDIAVLTELPNLIHVTLYGNDSLDFTKGSQEMEVVKELIANDVMVEWSFGNNEILITEVTDSTVGFELYFPEIIEFVSSYNIYVNGEFVDEIPTTESYYELTNLEPLSEVEITVDAVDENGYVWGSAYTYVTTPPVPEGEIVRFKDPALEEAVRDVLHIYSRDLFESDMTILTSLDASGREITDLSGLEFATNLSELYLDFNSIENLTPLADLKNLGYLSASYNQLSDISVLGNLTNLETLTLDGNEIVDISSLSMLTKLSFLSLQENNVQDIHSLTGLPIEFLNLSYNEIEDISSLVGLENLMFVLLVKNPLDLTKGSEALTTIETLENKGIFVLYEFLEISVGEVTDTSIEISWLPVTKDGYEDFLYSILLNGEEVEADVRGDSFRLNNLEPDTEYTIEVFGLSDDEERMIYGTKVVTTASIEEDPTDGEEPSEGTIPGDDENDPIDDESKDPAGEDKGSAPPSDNGKGSTSDNKETNPTGKLPKTATNNFNLLVIGMSLLVFGVGFFAITRKKVNK